LKPVRSGLSLLALRLSLFSPVRKRCTHLRRRRIGTPWKKARKLAPFVQAVHPDGANSNINGIDELGVMTS
jgi:hypothetical protein